MTPEEILAAAATLGLTDAKICDEARIPQAFLTKARAGQNRGPKARRSWLALERYVKTASVPNAPPPDPLIAASDLPLNVARTLIGAVGPESLTRIADKLGHTKQSVRKAFDAILKRLGPSEAAEAPLAIRDAMRAKDAPGLEHALAAVREAFAGGEIDDRMHAQFVASIKAQLASLAKRPEERPDPIAEALDVLTADEVDALEAFRSAHARAPLAPGEGVPPPEALAGGTK